MIATTGSWVLTYEGFDPKQERLREALTSTGNGYFCTRGAAEWADVDEVHYPATYTHGGYNRETSILGGRPVLNEDLVNLPNWLVLKLGIAGGDPVDVAAVDVLRYRHQLDVRHACVMRELRFRDADGRETTLASRRFVSMANMHVAGLEWTITAENWSGEATVITALDARISNRGVARYRELEGRHVHPIASRFPYPDAIALIAQTRQSRIYVAQAARTRVHGERGDPDVGRVHYQMEDYIHQAITFAVERGVPMRVEKMATFYTSRDRAINEPRTTAEKAIGRCDSYDEEFRRHAGAWDELWEGCDVHVPADDRAQQIIRLHISHILQVCSPHTIGLDAGVPARGLNGEAYRGHVFWDELFIYPFLNFRLPAVTRELLMYRRRRLDEARAASREAGHRGAMYPWQSGSDGREETQVVHLNPLSGRWEPDRSRNQRHVSAAIFYNAWQYYQATGDSEFLVDYGAEMMLEIARFWSSIAHFNAARGRYEIHGVMGPDEYHEGYPDSTEGGLRNNAYTNVMVAWLCHIAGTVLDLLPEERRAPLRKRIGLTDDEIETWDRMSRLMFVPFHGAGIISQFEGYEELEELDWDGYRRRFGNIQRMDRILKAEGGEPDRYKLAKQADAVLLFFLFSEDELREAFERLGYPYGPDTLSKNLAYYDRRTAHGSTLSFVAHAGVLAGVDLDASWDRYLTALDSDVHDVQGGTTAEGIHLGVMSGTLDVLQRFYLGQTVRDGMLQFRPRPMRQLDGLGLHMWFRGRALEVGMEHGRLRVAIGMDATSSPLRVGVGDAVHEIPAGGSRSFDV
jgi:trehalose/maltose hydrolase-like predicted phosphorylase